MPGGVCAVLDYEVDMMAEYVSEMAVRVVLPGNGAATAQFRKFVNQVLASTRLPSATILLGMNYLAKRVNTLKNEGSYDPVEGHVWRYLVIGLMLGSKFLDDNTFQNKSWSEVSQIPVSELNELELKWILSMKWLLYVNLDNQKDYHAWLDSWRQWCQMKKNQVATQVLQVPRDRLPLQPLDTNASRLNHSPPNRSGGFANNNSSMEGIDFQLAALGNKSDNQYTVQPPRWAHPWQQTPITPTDSGYGTPEYGLSATSANTRYEWPQVHNSAYRQQTAVMPAVYPTRQANYHPSYAVKVGTYGHGLHGECICHVCVNSKPSSFFDATKQPSYFDATRGFAAVMG